MDKISSIAVKVTDKLIEGGVSLQFKSDSLLAPAAGELQEEMPVDVVSTEDIAEAVNEASRDDTNPFLIEEELKEKEGLGDVYGHCVGVVVEPIKPMVAGIIARIREGIIPLTNSIFEKTYAAASEEIDRGGIRLTVTTDGSELPLWKSVAGSIGLDTIDPNVESAPNFPAGNFPTKTFTEIVADIHSVVPEFNADIDKILATSPEQNLVALYNYVFNVNVVTDPVGVEKHQYLEPKLQHLIIALLAHAYKAEIPEGVSGVNINDYNYHLDRIIAHGAKYLRLFLKRSEDAKAMGSLVLEYPAPDSEFVSGSKIVVNGLIYDDWLDAGGSVDAIYGAYIQGGRFRLGSDILEHKADLERAWTRRVGVAQSLMLDNFSSAFKAAVHIAIRDYGAETDTKVDGDAYKFIAKYDRPLTPDNAYTFVRKAVIEGFYGDGDHCEILELVDHLSEKVKGIELADAINIAITDWLVGWAVSQVKVESK